MRITVRVFGSLIPLLGDVLNIDLEEGAKMGVLKRLLFERLEKRLLKEELVGESESLVVLLNGRNIETLEGDETELRDGDLVILLPPFAGG
ncbi:MAG: MoaD/ThiS family protein [Candidatus Bathyarchaeia archaeon]|nr:MoaD/ThiS family protein [Candidatus Bathyarchaeota archaeon]